MSSAADCLYVGKGKHCGHALKIVKGLFGLDSSNHQFPMLHVTPTLVTGVSVDCSWKMFGAISPVINSDFKMHVMFRSQKMCV